MVKPDKKPLDWLTEEAAKDSAATGQTSRFAADIDPVPTPSPARDLQARIHAQFAPEVTPVWSRYVTLFMVVSLIGAWLLAPTLYTNI